MLNKVVILTGTFVIFISFLFAVAINKESSKRLYMRYFYLYPLIGLLISTNTILSRIFNFYNLKISYILQQFLPILDLIFWLSFFLTLFISKIDRKIIKWIFGATVVLVTVLFFNTDLNKPNLHSYSILNICKAIFCVLFYSSLFKNVPTLNIKLEPAFWIVTGLLFYSCLSIPFYSLHDYIKTQFPFIIARNIFIISNILFIIMHLFFIKAYICTTHLHKAL